MTQNSFYSPGGWWEGKKRRCNANGIQYLINLEILFLWEKTWPLHIWFLTSVSALFLRRHSGYFIGGGCFTCIPCTEIKYSQPPSCWSPFVDIKWWHKGKLSAEPVCTVGYHLWLLPNLRVGIGCADPSKNFQEIFPLQFSPVVLQILPHRQCNALSPETHYVLTS